MAEPGEIVPPAGVPAPAGGNFGLEDMLADAFAAFKNHFGILLGAFVVFAIISGLLGKFSLLALFVMPQLIAGFSFMMLQALRGAQPPRFSDLFKGFSYYVPLLVAGLLSGLLITVGTICLVVPGVILSLMWSQTMFLLADDMKEVEAGRKAKAQVSGWGAMQRSAALMCGHKLRFLGYAIVLLIIGLAGIIAAGIGVLVTMPFAGLAAAAFYNRLTKAA